MSSVEDGFHVEKGEISPVSTSIEIIETKNISISVGDNEHEAINTQSVTSLTALKDGRRAWVVCWSAFVLQITILGILHSYGVFFVAFLNDFNCSKASAAWIGSACYGVTMAITPLASWIINHFGHRVCACLGCLVCGIAMMVSSYMPGVNELYGSFTVLFALGCSLAYTPCMTITSDYFSKYASQATGIIVAGSSAGTLIYSPLCQALVTAYGWRITFRCLAGGCVIGFLCALQFKPLLDQTKRTEIQRIKRSMARRDMNDLQLWKNRVYIIWIVAIFCVMFGYYIPYVHLISHAVEIGVSPQLGSVLIMTLGGTCAIGRVVWGKILESHVLNRLQMDQLSMVITGTFVMLLPLFKSFAGLMVYVIVIGLLDGCYVVLLPTLTEAFSGNENKFLGWGFLNLVCSVSFTMGPVTAGWIYDATGSYNLAFHVAGIPIVVGAVILFFIPWAQKTSKSTNAMTAARQSYAGVPNEENVFTYGEYIEMTNAISIPKSQPESYEQSFQEHVLPFESRGSIVVVDLSTNTVQAFSTSLAGERHLTVTGDEQLPSAIFKAMSVLQKKSQSIMSLHGSYNEHGNTSSMGKPGTSFSVTPRIINSHNPNAYDRTAFIVGSQGTSPIDANHGLHYVRNVTSDQNRSVAYPATMSASSQTTESIPIASPPAAEVIGSPPEDAVTSPVGSPPQESDVLSSAYTKFQQISSNPSLPPIAEFPTTANQAIVNPDDNVHDTQDGRVPVNDNKNSVEANDTSVISSNSIHSLEGSPTENHAMFQMTDLAELSLSNNDLTDKNVDGDK